MKDPRHGVPSASGMYRLANCPASFEMERGRADVAREDAESGTRIHKALETGNFSELSPSEAETAGMCRGQEDTIIEDWIAPTSAMFFDELRLGLTTSGACVKVGDFPHKFLVTGQADAIGVSDKRGLVIDFKTSRGDHTPAESNDQLRTLAVLAARHFRLTSVRVALIQPWKGKPTVADYGAGALNEAHHWLLEVLSRAENSTPDDRNAGDWCHFCKAKDSCSTFRNKALGPVEVMAQNLPAVDETARKALFARAMELPADQLAGLVKGLKMVGWYAAAIEGAARQRAAEDPEFQQWYRMKPGAQVRTITDPQAAFQLAATHGVSTADFMACTKVNIGDLEEALRKASGPKITAKGEPHKTQLAMSAKGAAALIDTLQQAGALTRKQNADQLEEVTEQLEA